MLVAVVCGVGANLVQTGLMFTPDKLKMDFKKVSPLAGFKRVFGLDAMAAFVKNLIKVAMTALLGWWILKPHWSMLATLSALEPVAMMPLVLDILKRLVFSVAALTLAVAGADWFWQRQRFMTRQRMTREELKEDYKQSEGDPHVRARQKQIRQERARRRMMQAVPTATVVVMNPTHFAVALKYDDETPAPVCVAKGVDTLALKIREVAEAAGVAVIEDPPLARSLYAAVDIDEAIPPKHYEAVAKVIGFILNAGRRSAARLQ
jgi:flagellar biosynthetic protein FlhB